MRQLCGLVAEFPDAESLTDAARAARTAGYRRMDAFTPFPIAEVSHAVGYWKWAIPLIAVLAALIGGTIQYFLQYRLNAVTYPINVGGRPLHSWPAFIPATIVVSILWASASAMIGMLLINGLPRLNHPVFEAPQFEHASDDSFFFWIESQDPLFNRIETEDFLIRNGAISVREVSTHAC